MGCIYQRKDNGRWRLLVRYKMLPNISFHFGSYEEAKALDDEIKEIIKEKKAEKLREFLKQLGEQKVEVSIKEALTFANSKMGLVEFLQFDSYKHHREKHPEVKPEKWLSIFENQKKFEKIYQKELKK